MQSKEHPKTWSYCRASSELSLTDVLIKMKMDFERDIVCRSHLMIVSSECEVMFMFLSCSYTRGVDRTLCLHLSCPPFRCLCSCIMKSLFTLWNLKRYKQSCPTSFLSTVSASWKEKQKMDYLLIQQFKQQCSQLFYLIFGLSSHLSHNKAILFIQTGRCSDLICLLVYLGSH